MSAGFFSMKSRRRILSILAATVFGTVAATTASTGVASPGGGDATKAHASKMQIVIERSQMHLASAPGVTIKEVGTTTGTYSGTVVAYITSYSVSRGSLTLTAYVPGGTLTVRGETHNHVAGSTGYSEGTARVIHGTGRFAHASSSSLVFHALINRQNFHSTAVVRGPMSL